MIPKQEVANLSIYNGKSIDISFLHNVLGHSNEDTIRRTAKYHQLTLNGTMSKCEHCALAKARQKNVSKVLENKSETMGESLYIVISSVVTPTLGGNKYWLLVVDEFSDMCWSTFLRKKSDLSEHMIPFIKKLNMLPHIQIKYIRCDNAGENKFFERQSILANLNLTFEYTSPGAPQYNGTVERKFATLYGRVRSMLNAANLSSTLLSGCVLRLPKQLVILRTV
jgi:transposase InsO family protein